MFWDQEALNAVLAGKWGALDPRWNRIANPRGALPGEGQDGAWIYHFAGNVKPWAYPDGRSFARCGGSGEACV